MLGPPRITDESAIYREINNRGAFDKEVEEDAFFLPRIKTMHPRPSRIVQCHNQGPRSGLRWSMGCRSWGGWSAGTYKGDPFMLVGLLVVLVQLQHDPSMHCMGAHNGDL